MPIINVTMGEMQPKDKKELIRSLTDAAVKTTGIPEQSFTVLIQELGVENIGIGGKTLKEVMESH